jgi:para-nitrobenzyl esterase
MRTIGAALSGAAFVLAAATQAHAADPPLTVAVASCAGTSSTVTGFVGDYPGGATGSMRQFLGIPYAAPPTGNNRWMPPKTFCWNGNRAANMFGGTCAQGANTNEDCLFLNVFTQPTGTVKKLPVMVYIHGGGLTSGSGSVQLNPFPLVEQGVIVVTINYRIGALGFLAHPALDNAGQKRSGNYGILDQQAALQWVKANIAKFGGNPSNVTIFGQSAGALSIAVQLVSPLSTGLFQKAILESAPLNSMPLLSEAETLGNQFGAAVGCSTAKCFRSATQLPVATILANQGLIQQSARLLRQDGVVIPDQLRILFSTGKFKKVPIIVGSNHDESRFHINGNTNLGTGTLCNFVSNIAPSAGSFPGAVDLSTAMSKSGVPSNILQQVLGHYPAGANGLSANIAFADQQTDANFACRALRLNNSLAQNGAKNYAYEFNDAKAPVWLWPQFKLHDGTTFPYGAYHGAEQPYLFRMGPVNGCGGAMPKLSSAQKKLATAIVTYWTTFAKTGDPNPASGVKPPAWPRFAASNGNMMSLVAATPKLLKASAFDTDHQCSSFWNGLQQ